MFSQTQTQTYELYVAEYRSCTPKSDPSAANLRILVKIREFRGAPHDSAHSNKSDPRKPDPCDPAKHAETLSLGGIKAWGSKRMSALHGSTRLVGVRAGQSRRRRGKSSDVVERDAVECSAGKHGAVEHGAGQRAMPTRCRSSTVPLHWQT